MHAYPGGPPANEVNKQVSDFNSHQSWNVPDLIGEFNWEDNTGVGLAVWDAAVRSKQHELVHWSYKLPQAGGPTPGASNDPTGHLPSVPNIQSDP